MSADYADEKAKVGLEILATGMGSLRQRVDSAFSDQFRRVELHKMPWADLRENYDDLKKSLGSPTMRVSDALEAMADEQVCEVAQNMVWLMVKIIERAAAEQAVKRERTGKL